MQVRISRVDADIICVEFYMLEGSKCTFMKQYEEYRDKVLAFANDRCVQSKWVEALKKNE